jgi:NADH:ubiquinone oxidoreductase subunit C
MSTDNNKEELNKVPASNQPKDSTSPTTDDTTKQHQQPAPPSTQPKQVPAKTSQPSATPSAAAAPATSGTDYPKDNQIEVIYHLGSYTRQELAAHILWLTTRTNRDDARLPTLINVYKSVEYHERECYEMLGVYFEGHPRNERFLLPEDWADIPPLRRDFRIKGR